MAKPQARQIGTRVSCWDTAAAEVVRLSAPSVDRAGRRGVSSVKVAHSTPSAIQKSRSAKTINFSLQPGPRRVRQWRKVSGSAAGLNRPRQKSGFEMRFPRELRAYGFGSAAARALATGSGNYLVPGWPPGQEPPPGLTAADTESVTAPLLGTPFTRQGAPHPASQPSFPLWRDMASAAGLAVEGRPGGTAELLVSSR